MSRVQRRLLAAVGILSLLVAVAAIVAANREPGSRGAVLSASAQEGAGEDVTTTGRRAVGDPVALAPVHGGTPLPPAPTAPATPAPTAERSSTTTAPPLPALDPKGTAFGPASDTTARSTATGDCRALATPTWTVDDCGTVTSAAGPLTWLVESKAKGRRVTLLKPAGVGQWAPHLVASDDPGARWTDIRARVAEGPGGTNDQILGVGFRSRSTSALAVDLIHGGQVAGHVELAKGSARISRSQLDTWSSQADGTYAHQTVRWHAQAWRILNTEQVSPQLVPPSHL